MLQDLNPSQWPTNLESERIWRFMAQPSVDLNGRSIPLAMGKVLGGGSSVNVMVWARGHQNDWDYFANEANDEQWNYNSVLMVYRRMESWKGNPDLLRHGTSGPVHVAPAQPFNQIAPAVLDSALTIGLKLYESPNGEMMESDDGAARVDTLWHSNSG